MRIATLQNKVQDNDVADFEILNKAEDECEFEVEEFIFMTKSVVPMKAMKMM